MQKRLQKSKWLWNRALYIFPLLAGMIEPAAHAQSIRVSGVISTAGSAVAYASVTFTDVDDPSHPVSTVTDEFGNYQINFLTSAASATISPSSYRLEQNYPNPFSSATSIAYQLEKPANAVISIFDILGREVKRFTMGMQPDGVHNILWDGKNDLGGKLIAGAYFYRLQTADKIQVRKMLYFPGQHPANDVLAGTTARTSSGQNFLPKAADQQSAIFKVQLDMGVFSSCHIFFVGQTNLMT
jgi:hypothetical protein